MSLSKRKKTSDGILITILITLTRSHARRNVHVCDMEPDVSVPEVDDRLPVRPLHVYQALVRERLQLVDAPDAQRVHDRPRLRRRDPDTAHLARESFLVRRGPHVRMRRFSPSKIRAAWNY